LVSGIIALAVDQVDAYYVETMKREKKARNDKLASAEPLMMMMMI